jgi:tRNA uridine 5-carboxymethylaminomethyl modification enzyme
VEQKINQLMKNIYDIIVVGAGHAGNEAAASSANLGSKTLLITMDMNKIGQMSCNPAMGGIAKGQIVREIDALGGYSGLVSDASAIQFRMLNRSKGPAMWSPRTQNDRAQFADTWRYYLENTSNVDFWQDHVTEVIFENQCVAGVKTGLGVIFYARAVVITSGTFLNGVIHIGEKNFGGGRIGEKRSEGLTEQLNALGLKSGRMKTGTPPRLDGRTIDYSKLSEQPGDENPGQFSFLPHHPITSQISCWITYTSPLVHEILEEGFEHSPMFAGRIQGVGPRYCPSIEDKIVRFADKTAHQLFVEPEGRRTYEIYLNGFSTSLPEEIQYRALREIAGLENVKMFRPGYAIEYDYFYPDQLLHSLQAKGIPGLYLAGQINGTTGYEEAACQGLMAGINAALFIKEQEPLILSRDQAYIGVLIDDLITKSTDEPYRMFTSRAEYRTLLRQDNADERLTPLSHAIGLASDERMERLNRKATSVQATINILQQTSAAPEEINTLLESKGSSPITQKTKLSQVLSRPGIALGDLLNILPEINIPEQTMREEVLAQAEIQIKYSGYIEKERELANKLNRLEYVKIPEIFDYSNISNLSYEAKSKLSRIRPENIGQASRISGVNPSDIAILLMHLGR